MTNEEIIADLESRDNKSKVAAMFMRHGIAEKFRLVLLDAKAAGFDDLEVADGLVMAFTGCLYAKSKTLPEILRPIYTAYVATSFVKEAELLLKKGV